LSGMAEPSGIINFADVKPAILWKSFFQDDVQEIQWDDGPVYPDDAGDRYFLLYRDRAKIDKTKKNEKEIVAQADKYIEILKEESKDREGLFSGVKKADEIHNIPGMVLDRNFYYVNRGDFDSIYLVGDLHGSKLAFKKALKKANFFEAVKDRPGKILLVFLGDFIDRGEESLWVLFHALKLKNTFPKNVILLRGNHEFFVNNKDGGIRNSASPADLFEHVGAARVAGKAEEIGAAGLTGLETLYSETFTKSIFGDLFKRMPTAAFIVGQKTILAAHSGFPRPDVNVEWELLKETEFDYFKLKRAHPEKADRYTGTSTIGELNGAGTMEDLVWTELTREKYRDSRGGGTRKEICTYCQANFMDKFGIQAVIRGHDHPEKGVDQVRIMDGGFDVYTVFTAGGFADIYLEYKKHKAGLVMIDPQENIVPIMIKGGGNGPDVD
ncbi:MAG: serine/threonine protein phosphatase, partial [Candidatus Aminicenantes bacterium]|nr:serine/threonine protein phosphatase [Candidatus Aminicenantes bacterium]